jgi:hypothetical protein
MALWRYAATPGVAGNPPAYWPRKSRITRDPKRLMLVMIAHPHCPCTRASLGELEEVMAHSSGHLRAVVIFVNPANFGDDWMKTDLWFSLAKIPAVSPLIDEGSELERFGGATSRETMVDDRNGKLVFSGAITAARGHWGDNQRIAAIRKLLNVESLAQFYTAGVWLPT